MSGKYPAGIRPSGRGLRVRIWERGKEVYAETIECDPDCPDAVRAAVRRRDKLASQVARGIDPVMAAADCVDDVDLEAAYRNMFKQARGRKHGYNLTPEDEEFLIERSMGQCSLTGVPLSVARHGAKKAPFAPSLDRIDSSKPYTADNCRIVCTAANFAMNEWGTWVFDKIARAYCSELLRQD